VQYAHPPPMDPTRTTSPSHPVHTTSVAWPANETPGHRTHPHHRHLSTSPLPSRRSPPVLHRTPANVNALAHGGVVCTLGLPLHLRATQARRRRLRSAPPPHMLNGAIHAFITTHARLAPFVAARHWRNRGVSLARRSSTTLLLTPSLQSHFHLPISKGKIKKARTSYSCLQLANSLSRSETTSGLMAGGFRTSLRTCYMSMGRR
jgi:hypothetical protein